jgi:serine/threonine protein kinase
MYPAELHKIFSQTFRDLTNSGTRVFTGPEFPFHKSMGVLTSAAFLPCDIWAVGWILLQILSGYKIQYLHDSDEKKILANSSQQELWTNYLLSSGPLSKDPEVLSVIDLAMGLLREDPAERLTTKQALAHPFLSICAHRPA